VFAPDLHFDLQVGAAAPDAPLARLPSLFREGVWPAGVAGAEELERFLHIELPQMSPGSESIARVVDELGTMHALLADPAFVGDAAVRLRRRIEAVERVALHWSGAKVALDVPPGTFAIAGEEFVVGVYVHVAAGVATTIRAEGIDGIGLDLQSAEVSELTLPYGGTRRIEARIRVPLRSEDADDPMAKRFRGDRFVPPVRVRFHFALHGMELPVELTVPVEERPPVEVAVLPRLLLLPDSRRELQFSVRVVRNTRFPIEGDLEVRAPAGYAIKQDRRKVHLRDRRGDLFRFEVRAAEGRRSGVDVLRIALAGTRVALPIHKVDVKVPPTLRIGVLRGRDDTLPGILGVGGLGLSWSELSDADVAAGDLGAFDTVVVDVRALRDRPDARRGFRRLLEFAAESGHRLVVFYHKDIEFHQPGESFLGAPLTPFQIGKARITRADAPVEMLLPDHVLFNRPNQIKPWDWDGWGQERALYLPEVYSDEFDELIELNDPGQPSERGALLYTRTGQGEYVYCSLALWRQLKKLHPGAVRLLANLLTPSPRK